MKTLLIGDIHGRTTWKEIIQKESPNRVVFFGDYFDSFTISGIDQIHNFNQIIEFKETTDIEVIMLVGNHDHHYMNVGETYSGFQPALQHDIYFTLKENTKHLQVVYLFDNILCSHAGISPIWLDQTFGLWSKSTMVDDVNELYNYQPRKFNFSHKGFDPYGDSVEQGPLWIRPRSLMKSNKGDDGFKKNFIQVFGHTQLDNIHNSFISSEKSMGGKYYNIDVLESGGYVVHENNELIKGEI
jgi:hypothetical protein